MYRPETRHFNNLNLPAADLVKRGQHFFNPPTTGGTAMNATGNIYFANVNHKRLLKISPNSQATTLLSDYSLMGDNALYLDSQNMFWIPAPRMTRTACFHQDVSMVQGAGA
jgi:hypothetical protein